MKGSIKSAPNISVNVGRIFSLIFCTILINFITIYQKMFWENLGNKKGILQLWHSNFAIFRNTLINKYSSDWLNQIFAHRKKNKLQKNVSDILKRQKWKRLEHDRKNLLVEFQREFFLSFAWTWVFAVHRIFFGLYVIGNDTENCLFPKLKKKF